MANIKDLKKKIKSTKGTLKITRAMKLVSAAKLSRAQIAITNSRPYASELEKTIKAVSALVQNYKNDFLKETDNKQTALIIISSDKGLCGGYNSQLAKKVLSFIKDSDFDIKVFYIGKKVKGIIKASVNEGKHFTFEKSEPSFLDIKAVAQELGELFKAGEFGKVFVAYNVFKSAMQFIPSVKQLLPLTLDEQEKKKLIEEFSFDFKYEPGAEEILDTIIPEVYISTLYTCLLDGIASEHGTRMSAMENASQNCKEAIRTQTLKMNKLRQAAITTELIEVVSGAEALKG